MHSHFVIQVKCMKEIELWSLLHKVPHCSEIFHHMPLMCERATSLKMQTASGIEEKKEELFFRFVLLKANYMHKRMKYNLISSVFFFHFL